MLANRVIPVLILERGMVVESHQFLLTNVIHTDPSAAFRFMDAQAADEIIVLDVSRDRSRRDLFYAALREIAETAACPVTAGGWVDSVWEAERVFSAGADKLAVNTVTKRDPDMVREIATRYGCQAVVVSIDISQGRWVVDRGRRDAGLLRDAIKTAFDVGAGEILLASVDNEGTNRGYDLLLLADAVQLVNVPLIAFGGVANHQHLADGLAVGVEAVAAANYFHYQEHSVRNAKNYLKKHGAFVR